MTPLQRHVDPDDLKKWDNPTARAYMKSPEQGAATTVWAAIAREWGSKGGKYLEDCDVSPPHSGGMLGYAPWAYDAKGAAKLWDVSLALVGLEK